MQEKTMQAAMEEFILERVNHYSAQEPDGLQKVHEQLEICTSKLKESLSPKQEPLFTECENAYALVDGETMYCYYRAGFADAVLFLLGWRDGNWN